MIKHVKNISIDLIDSPSISLRRVERESADYVTMLQSVKEHGILQPISVVRVGDRYELVDGAYRLSIAKELDYGYISCSVEDEDVDIVLLQLQANAVRAQTSNLDYAARLARIMKDKNLTMKELAALVNRSSSWLSKVLALNMLCGEAKDAVRRGDLPVSAASELAKLPQRMQKRLLKLATEIPAKDFAQFARRQLKEHKEAAIHGTQVKRTEAEQGAYLRTWSELEHEIESNENAGLLLTVAEAKTPLDGWRACLAWLLHFDPISIKDRDQRFQQLKRRVTSLAEMRQRSRRIYQNLVEGKPDDEEK